MNQQHYCTGCKTTQHMNELEHDDTKMECQRCKRRMDKPITRQTRQYPESDKN